MGLRYLLFLKIFIALLLIQNISLAQTITLSGTVTDKVEKISLDSALVEIVNKNNPLEKYSTFSDASGSWQYQFTPSDVNDKSDKPINFSLSQNYPNPFNPSTKINFSLMEYGTVTFTAYSVIGEEIDRKTFQLDAGNYSVTWTSKGSAGVILYSMEFDNRQIVKKMIQLDGGGSGGWGAISGSSNTFLSKGNEITNAEFYVIASKLAYEPDTTLHQLTGNLKIDFELDLVHNAAFVIDLHNDILELLGDDENIGDSNPQYQTDLPRLKAGGVDAQVFAMWPNVGSDPSEGYEQVIGYADKFFNQVDKNSFTLMQATNPEELQSGIDEGKIAGILAVEGGSAIEDDLNKLKEFYDLGVRYMTITWNYNSNWAVSAKDAESKTRGLSEFGKQVIKMMDSLGMIIDVSHTGVKTIEDILTVTKNPIIASHSGVWKLNNHYRNLTDAQIISIAKSRGLIGVVFYKSFLSRSNDVTIETVIQHIDYIKKLVGINFIALGSDFDGGITTPVGLEDASKFPALTYALLKHGYTNSEVKQILGGNFLRVFNEVCGKKNR
ncbi:MAG: membrane dipeptidase [Ignavibacteriales bacterium]|nr:MAG: membrane dipeptidase [Ignavibacteriales bacterium]